MDKYYLNLYHKGIFVGKFISISHLLVMSDYPHTLRNKLKKDFAGSIPTNYEDHEFQIKILSEPKLDRRTLKAKKILA